MVSLQAALTREHRDIDAFVADLDRGVVGPEALLNAFEALRRHIYLEAEFLFPPIRQVGLTNAGPGDGARRRHLVAANGRTHRVDGRQRPCRRR